MVSSIRGFAQELGSTHVVKSHVQKQRTHTLRRTVTSELEYETLKAHASNKLHHKKPSPLPNHFDITNDTNNIDMEKAISPAPREPHQKDPKAGPVTASLRMLKRIRSRQPKLLLMRQEKDRFDAMRKIQYNTHRFKRYSALTMSVIACKSWVQTLLSTKQGNIGIRRSSHRSEGLFSYSWTPLVRRRCRFLDRGIEIPRSELFSGPLLLLRLPTHHRLRRPEPQKQRRKTIVYRLVTYRRSDHDNPHF